MINRSRKKRKGKKVGKSGNFLKLGWEAKKLEKVGKSLV
jgi:hypothetical protein